MRKNGAHFLTNEQGSSQRRMESYRPNRMIPNPLEPAHSHALRGFKRIAPHEEHRLFDLLRPSGNGSPKPLLRRFHGTASPPEAACELRRTKSELNSRFGALVKSCKGGAEVCVVRRRRWLPLAWMVWNAADRREWEEDPDGDPRLAYSSSPCCEGARRSMTLTMMSVV